MNNKTEATFARNRMQTLFSSGRPYSLNFVLNGSKSHSRLKVCVRISVSCLYGPSQKPTRSDISYLCYFTALRSSSK